jgi:hypothetical protein
MTGAARALGPVSSAADRGPAVDQRQEDLVNDLGEDGVWYSRDAARHVLVAQQRRRRGSNSGVQCLRRGLADSAERAERLRRAGAEIVFLTGSEISLFTVGFLPGNTVAERLADPQRLRAALPSLPAKINAFLGEAVAAVRAKFGGRIGYASLPHEGVDWAPFDVVATDACYPDAQTADRLADGLRALTAHGKPAAVTEFGCTTYRGAADVAGRGDAIVAWGDRARPVRLTSPVVRDEQEQAGYLCELLDAFDRSAIDAVFVNTFARYDLPHTDTDDDRDFDKASFGIVKVLDGGRTGTAYPGLPWEPKAAFHTLANYGRVRLGGIITTGARP